MRGSGTTNAALPLHPTLIAPRRARPLCSLLLFGRSRGRRQRADLVSPPNKDAAPFPAQTAPAPSVPPEPPSPETHEVLPPSSKDVALGSAIAADTGAA